MEPKSPEWYALRNLTIELLRQDFGSYKEAGSRLVFDCTNEKIAKDLDYTSGHISRFLKDPAIDKKPLGKKGIHTILERIFKRRADKKYQQKKKTRLLGIFSLCLLCLFLGGWLSNVIFSSQRAINNESVIEEFDQLRNIMEWHGNLIAYQLVWQAIELNNKVKQQPEPLTAAYIETERSTLEEKIGSIIREGRATLGSFGFVNEEGVNIVTILDEISPRSTLFTPQDTFLRPRLEAVFPQLLDRKASLSDIEGIARFKSRNTQEAIWDAMWEKGWEQKNSE